MLARKGQKCDEIIRESTLTKYGLSILFKKEGIDYLNAIYMDAVSSVRTFLSIEAATAYVHNRCS